MKINKKKFIVRIIEAVITVVTIIVTVISIEYATKMRGHAAIGGEYLVPVLGLIAILIIETIYEESENKKRSKKHGRR